MGHPKAFSLHCKQDSSWSLNSSVYWRLNAWVHNMLSWTFIRLSWQCNISLYEGLRGNCWVSVSLHHSNHAALCKLAVVKWLNEYYLGLPINIDIPYLKCRKVEIKLHEQLECLASTKELNSNAYTSNCPCNSSTFRPLLWNSLLFLLTFQNANEMSAKQKKSLPTMWVC